MRLTAQRKRVRFSHEHAIHYRALIRTFPLTDVRAGSRNKYRSIVYRRLCDEELLRREKQDEHRRFLKLSQQVIF